MSNKNYYDILGVSKTATEEEIKKAYRKQAMKHHPDRNKGEKIDESKIKEINEAYETLSDKTKKKQYDTFGSTGNFGGFSGNTGGSSAGFSGYEDIFSNFSRGGAKQQTSGFDFDLGDLFGNFAGGNAKKQKRQTYDYEDMFSGQQKKEELNLDLEKIYEVAIFDLILGTKIDVEGADKQKAKLKIPENTKPGTKFKVKEFGKSLGSKKGNLIVKIEARMPKHISDLDKKLLESIKNNIAY